MSAHCWRGFFRICCEVLVNTIAEVLLGVGEIGKACTRSAN